jgi:hypothetical protein
VDLFTSLRNALIAVVVPTVLYGAVFVWGAVYDQTRLEAWGFNASLFPLSTQQAYLQAFSPAVGVSAAPLIAMQQHLGLWFGVLFVAPALLMAFVAKRYGARMTAWVEGRRRAANKAIDADLDRAFRWGVAPTVVLLSVPALCAAVVTLLALVIIPPYELGLRDGRRAWEREDYKSWATATWVEDGGAVQSGYLSRCNERWCAVLTAQREAIAIPAGKVKRVSRTSAQASTSPASALSDSGQ